MLNERYFLPFLYVTFFATFVLFLVRTRALFILIGEKNVPIFPYIFQTFLFVTTKYGEIVTQLEITLDIFFSIRIERTRGSEQ